MADSNPAARPKCPASARNGVRHAAGMVSAIIPESRPSWTGARSHRHRLGESVLHVEPHLVIVDVSAGHGAGSSSWDCPALLPDRPRSPAASPRPGAGRRPSGELLGLRPRTSPPGQISHPDCRAVLILIDAPHRGSFCFHNPPPQQVRVHRPRQRHRRDRDSRLTAGCYRFGFELSAMPAPTAPLYERSVHVSTPVLVDKYALIYPPQTAGVLPGRLQMISLD